LQHSVSFVEAFRVWIKVAIYSFGGPTGQIAVMHRLLVDEKRWVSENRFLHALNYCMFLPGPEAQQLAIYIGWLLHKTTGGLVAGCLFVLPGFLSILVLSILYAGFQDVTVVQALFFGLKPAVLAVVAGAVILIGRRVLKNRAMIGIATLAFVGIFFFELPFPLIIGLAGLTGFVGGRLRPDLFHILGKVGPGNRDRTATEAAISDSADRGEKPNIWKSIRVIALWLSVWFAPLLVLAVWQGAGSIFVVEGVFFSKAAVVTFGGAYSVLAYIAQQAVETFGWLQPGEMLDGLGMAETTPGPLIQVVQFVGFMGAYRNPGTMDPMWAGLLGSLITTWVTFAPSFLWIFLGAPYIEYLRGNRSMSSALSGITAAVVGVVANLAVWFSLHTLFDRIAEVRFGDLRLLIPELNTLDWAALTLAIGAFVSMTRFKLGMIPTLTGSAALGLFYYLLFVV
jgi:chromate transporter